jgi:hypothetical protein
MHQQKLRRLVRWACRQAAERTPGSESGIEDVRDKAKQLGLSGASLYATHGQKLTEALLKTGAKMRAHEVLSLKPLCVAATGELPEDA